MKAVPCLFILALVFMTACSPYRGVPDQFTTTMSQGWSTIELRDDVEFERAWKTVYRILVRDFDIEFASKEEGYLRTGWLYSWSGVYQDNYKVRVTCKFSDDKKRLEIKPQAMALINTVWEDGVDTRLVSTLKSDMMGTIGRTTR